jgi:hypothetical protein
MEANLKNECLLVLDDLREVQVQVEDRHFILVGEEGDQSHGLRLSNYRSSSG